MSIGILVVLPVSIPAFLSFPFSCLVEFSVSFLKDRFFSYFEPARSAGRFQRRKGLQLERLAVMGQSGVDVKLFPQRLV